jgi:hypothetical protein
MYWFSPIIVVVLASSVLACPVYAQPRQISDSQLDVVTAGSETIAIAITSGSAIPDNPTAVAEGYGSGDIVKEKTKTKIIDNQNKTKVVVKEKIVAITFNDEASGISPATAIAAASGEASGPTGNTFTDTNAFTVVTDKRTKAVAVSKTVSIVRKR